MSALPKLMIVGAGGFGREMLAWARQAVQCGVEWEVGDFIDDNLAALDGKNTPARVVGRISDYQPKSDEVFICALGVPAVKRKAMELLLARGAVFARLIHRTAVIGDNVEMAAGVVMCPYSIASANNRLGVGVALNLHATVDHDATVDDWSQINCHCDLTAAVRVGKEVFLGSRVSIIPNVQVGDRAYIGAGSVVLRDVVPGAKVVGSPARRIG
jgi:sugar O-acyltransferase (sialic acid O-acetyltransferase NeuD family)